MAAATSLAPSPVLDAGLGLLATSGPEPRPDSPAAAAQSDKANCGVQKDGLSPIPRHPISSMQDAFAESLVEATKGGIAPKPKLNAEGAAARRQALLDQPRTDPPPATHWRLRPGQWNHELRKLMAQVSFGVYLLLKGMANSNDSVVAILQGHINEVDEFLETTMEDLELAVEDITARLEHLSLPMNNLAVFEQMLEDRNFRLSIVKGNEQIEHIISRTATALVQSTSDIAEGLQSTSDFTAYLRSQQDGPWKESRPDVIDIFEAMKGNTEGWFNAFITLQGKANTLSALIAKLNAIIADIDRRAGEVSRRTRFSIQPFTIPITNNSPPSSRGSSTATPTSPPESPRTSRLPDQPPRISMRFSSDLKVYPMAPAFFTTTLPGDNADVTAVETAATPPSTIYDPSDASTTDSWHDATSEHVETFKAVPVAVTETKSQEAGDSPKIEEKSSTEVESPIEEECPIEEESPTYILLPRTYTPKPEPSPRSQRAPSLYNRDSRASRSSQPTSPAIQEERDAPQEAPFVDAQEVVERPATARQASAEDQRLGGQILPQQHLVAEELEAPLFQAQSPLRRESERQSIEKKAVVERFDDPKSCDAEATGDAIADQAGQGGQGQELKPMVSSLRQRVSLKKNPPHSIQVPPPSGVHMRRPTATSPKQYPGHDSAYASDIERPIINRATNSSLVDLSPPVLRPGFIPSPQSEQHVFRPIQASLHSPLQRPHTSCNLAPPQAHYPPPPRNIPSAMGMSMRSNMTTLSSISTNENPKLKKKRSAFGWLKKAFSLDEEERAMFEQRKTEQDMNLYYDRKSPKFLDGRRIR